MTVKKLTMKLMPNIKVNDTWFCEDVNATLRLLWVVTDINKPNVLVNKDNRDDKRRLKTVAACFVDIDTGRRFTDKFISDDMLQIMGASSKEELKQIFNRFTDGRFRVKMLT